MRATRVRLGLTVWGVLVSQVVVYPGLSETIAALGGGGGILAATWFLLAEYAAFVAFAVVWGAVSDAVGRRRSLVVAGALGGAASYLLVALAPRLGVGFGVVLALRAVGGACTIGAFSLGITRLMDVVGGHGRNMGVAGTAIGLGAALGSVGGGQLANVDPLAPVVAGAVVLLVVAALAATVPDRQLDRSRDSPFAGLRETPELLVPFTFGYVDRLTAGFFALTGVFYFRTRFGVDAAVAGATLAAFFLPFAVFQYPLGRLSDRVGRFWPVVGGSVCYGVAILAVGVAPTYATAAVVMAVVGVCGALVSPATMALVSTVAADNGRGAAMGGFNVFGSLGFLSGFLIGGVVTDRFGFLPAFVVVGGLELAVAALAGPVVWRLHRAADG